MLLFVIYGNLLHSLPPTLIPLQFTMYNLRIGFLQCQYNSTRYKVKSYSTDYFVCPDEKLCIFSKIPVS